MAIQGSWPYAGRFGDVIQAGFRAMAGEGILGNFQNTLAVTLGVRARLTAHVQDRRLVRELFPINSYRSQMPTIVHFGLADADHVEQLEIRWPSGKTQILSNVKADQFIIVDEEKEGVAAIESVTPGTTIRP